MNPTKIKTIYDGTTKVFNSLVGTQKEKTLILDPFTCMARLAMLSFKDKGTKISVGDNRISFYEADLFQGAIRWSYGDTRNDLHNLNNPIKKALEWYDINCKEIEYIFERAINGLEILKLAYDKNTIINHSLNLYIKNIKEILTTKRSSKGGGDTNSNSNMNGSLNTMINMENSILNILPDDDSTDKERFRRAKSKNRNQEEFAKDVKELYNNIMYKSLRELWSYRQIQTVYNLICEVEEKRSDNDLDQMEAYLSVLNKFLNIKEESVQSIIVKATTELI